MVRSASREPRSSHAAQTSQASGEADTLAWESHAAGECAGAGESDLAIDSAPKEAPPEFERIGPYRILQKLGEGGLGDVYLAEQEEPIRRKVALKIIKLARHTPEVAARFESEIRTIALLDHPNVTKALDAGTTEDGRPYYVMEYVPGIPITDYCDRNRLTIELRLQLFAQVCLAIHHAHQKAIIHRDIKPSNVLVTVVDDQAVPKVIDFGIVRALQAPPSDRPLVTLHGDLLGTPEYMSPEQAEMSALAVDTRADVYSLGALLYELLVGALPFDSALLRQAGHDGIPRLIRESDLTPLSKRLDQLGGRAHDVAHRRRVSPKTLRRKLRGELEWIVAKAMDKDPTRRYASASEFGADVQRHLKHEAIVAAPASIMYRTKNLIRAHRAMVITTVVVITALVVGFIEVTEGWFMQRRARIEALEEVRRSDAVLEHLLRSLEAIEPEARGEALSAQRVLGAAATGLEDVFSSEPDVEATAHNTMGRFYMILGHTDRAEEHLRRAVAMRKAIHGTTAAPTTESMVHLANLLIDLRQLDEAELLLVKALEIDEEEFGADDPQTIHARFCLSRLRAEQGRTDAAAKLCRSAIEAFERTEIRDAWRLATYRSECGEYLVRLGAYPEAEGQLLQSVGDFKALLGEEHAETRRAEKRLELLYEVWDKPDQVGAHVPAARDEPHL